ncbi:MAG TPA: DUF1616 domain-containing protein [Chloroflexota bacterium]|nr:DUF1616 domain-containing protein [Chloroflexota bacterium]
MWPASTQTKIPTEQAAREAEASRTATWQGLPRLRSSRNGQRREFPLRLHAPSTLSAPVYLGLFVLLSLLATGLALAGQVVPALAAPGWLWIKVPLGLLALLVFPGYALTATLFPRSRDIDGFERSALAIGLSVSQLPLLVLLLDRSPWRLSPAGLTVAVAALTVLWTLAALWRLRRLAPDEAFRPAGWLAQPPWSAGTGMEGAATLISVVLVVIVGWALLTLATRPAAPPMTEFYMLGGEGLVENFPRSAAPGEPIGVTLGVVNHEGRPMEYHVVAYRGDVTLIEAGPFRVESGGRWSQRLSFALPEYGFDQQVEIVLFRAGNPEPYRRLQLVLDVPAPGLPTPVRIILTPTPTTQRSTPTPAPQLTPTPAAPAAGSP